MYIVTAIPKVASFVLTSERLEYIHVHVHCVHIKHGQVQGAATLVPPKAVALWAIPGKSGPVLDTLLKPGQILTGALTVPSDYGEAS